MGIDVEGRPDISSVSSVTTRPLAVISLLRITRLWGNNPLDVCTCCLIAEFLKPKISMETAEDDCYVLVDSLQNIKDHVICELRVGVLKFSESSLEHAERFDLSCIHVIMNLLRGLINYVQ